METTVKERLTTFIKAKGMTGYRFEKRLGFGNGFVRSISKSIGADKLARILSVFPELNPDWLLYGTGEMYRQEAPATASAGIDGTVVPLLPFSAQGGTLNDFTSAVRREDCETFVSPIKDVDFAMTVTGNSMEPEYPNGSKILIKRIDEKLFIEWGRVYVLDTRNGSVIKEVRKGEKEGTLLCCSLNPDPKYAPFEVNISDLFGMYRVLLCMALK